MQHCVSFSKIQNLDSLILYTNSKLKNAVHIYKKFGFKELPLDKGNPYMPANIKMELKF